jgi:hypothetical protein
MGLFTQRPEFDDELPGLPGEPLRPESHAERLADDAPAMDALTLLGGGAVESIVIPVAPVVEIAQESTESGEAPLPPD